MRTPGTTTGRIFTCTLRTTPTSPRTARRIPTTRPPARPTPCGTTAETSFWGDQRDRPGGNLQHIDGNTRRAVPHRQQLARGKSRRSRCLPARLLLLSQLHRQHGHQHHASLQFLRHRADLHLRFRYHRQSLTEVDNLPGHVSYSTPTWCPVPGASSWRAHGGSNGNTIDSCVIYSTASRPAGFAILDGVLGHDADGLATISRIYGPLTDAR